MENCQPEKEPFATGYWYRRASRAESALAALISSVCHHVPEWCPACGVVAPESDDEHMASCTLIAGKVTLARPLGNTMADEPEAART